MHRRRRWNAIILGLAAMLTLASVAPAGAQTPDEVGGALCTLFSKKQVREAFGHKVGNTDEVPGECVWGLLDRGDYGGSDLQLQISWEDVGFDDLDLVTPAATELTVGERRARYTTEDGEVLVPGTGQVTRPIYSTLTLDLDPGPLTLHLTDTKGSDRQGMLTGLGELALANAGALVSPPARDETLATLVPPTIGGRPTVIRRVLFPSQEFCSRCDSGKALRKELKAQDKAVTDVSMITASGVDPARAGEDDFRQPAIRALRVAGADATQLVEPVITYLFEGSGVEPLRADSEGTVAVTRPGDQYNAEWSSVVYPQGDTLWVVTAAEPVRTELLAALPGAPVTPPVPTPAPTPTPDLSTPEGYLKSLLPATLGGEQLTAQVYSATDVLPAADQKAFKALLKKQGKTLADLSVLGATTSSGTQILAYRVAGGDAVPLEEAVLGQLRRAGQIGKKAKPQPVEIAGKPMRSIKTLRGDAHLYPRGDVFWLVEASDEAALTELFTALP